MTDFDAYLLTRLIQTVTRFWMTCPVEVVRANWMPSQADRLLAYRAGLQAAA